jgi:hypothetical protein
MSAQYDESSTANSQSKHFILYPESEDVSRNVGLVSSHTLKTVKTGAWTGPASSVTV